MGVAGVAYVTLPTLMIPRTTVSAAPAITLPKQPEPEKPKGLPRSLPTHLDIPDIGVSTDLVELGKNEDGSMQTPNDYVHAGWYKYSPTPGEVGPSIITGHVDNYLGPAVFFYLKELQAGQQIKVQRQDGKTVAFSVEKVELFSQSDFPTDAVYGNIDYPGLRLITCGGTFNAFTGHYSDNVVVYARYVES
jgi:sortase (surface protein transpeptidase)